jgi:F-type H+-transporting ATPase subunit a
MSLFTAQAAQPTIQPETVFTLGTVMITNAMLMGVFVTLVYCIISFVISRKISEKPSTVQVVGEMITESFTNLLAQITGSKASGRALLPLIGALFLFLGLSNIIGLIPGLTSITYDGTAIFRTPTNDFNMTFSIATAIVIFTQFASLKAFGFFGHLGKFFKIKGVIDGFKEGIGAGMLAIIDFLIGLLDIISEFAKVISLSLRLFGNMYAGEVLAALLLGTFAVALPAPWMAMNLLVGVLQALVFGALSASYYALAVEGSDAIAQEDLQ